MLGYYIFRVSDYSQSKISNFEACHTYEFMIQETFLLLVMIGFYFACRIIERIIKEEIRQMKESNE